jgi:hypothetical protein
MGTQMLGFDGALTKATHTPYPCQLVTSGVRRDRVGSTNSHPQRLMSTWRMLGKKSGWSSSPSSSEEIYLG